MNRIILVAMTALMSVPLGAGAQSAEQEIERALAAAPPRAREGAMVIRWNADHTYDVLKEGTNRIFCYDRSSDPDRQPFAVQCTSVGNLERVQQNRRFDAEAIDGDALAAMLDEAEANGTRAVPEYGSIWYTMNGPDMENGRMHTTVAVPGATAESTGFPDNSQQGGVWIMAAGTSAAHLMIPGR